MLKNEILKLRETGLTYQQIADKLNCTKSVVCYHLGKNQKQKSRNRQRKNRAKHHPYQRKTENFLNTKSNTKINKPTHKTRKLIQLKIETFCSCRKTNMYQKPNFNYQDVINKFGENPRCYLTGEPIDINKPRTYNFDHIVPVSKGGQNTLDNLGICTKQANSAKSDMLLDEFIEFCKKVVEHYKGR